MVHQDDKVVYIRCACEGHMFSIERDEYGVEEEEGHKMWYAVFWRRGHGHGKMPWKFRLTQLWLCLKGEHPRCDEIVMNVEEMRQLQTYVNEQLEQHPSLTITKVISY